MIAEAVLFPPERDGVPTQRIIAGLTLAERALLTVARAGIPRCRLAPGVDPGTIRATVRARAAAEGCTLDTAPPAGSADRVLLALDTVADPGALRAFAGAAASVGGGRVPVGGLAVSLDALPAGVGFPSVAERLAALPRPAVGWIVTVTPESVRRLGRVLLARLPHPRDGIVDRFFNRYLSAPLTRVLLLLGLTPNQITFASFLVALAGAASVAVGGYVPALVGAVLFQLSIVIDCSDGEVARLTFRESRAGDWFDLVCDNIAHMALFVAIAVGLTRTGQLASAAWLGAAAAGGVVVAFVLVSVLGHGPRQPVAGGRLVRWVRRLINALLPRDFSVAVLAAAAIGRLDWFLWAAAVGVNLFSFAVIVLLVAAGRSGRREILGRGSALNPAPGHGPQG